MSPGNILKGAVRRTDNRTGARRAVEQLQATRGLAAGDENVTGASALEAGTLVLDGLQSAEEFLERRAADDGVELRPIIADQADPFHVEVVHAPAPRLFPARPVTHRDRRTVPGDDAGADHGFVSQHRLAEILELVRLRA